MLASSPITLILRLVELMVLGRYMNAVSKDLLPTRFTPAATRLACVYYASN